MLNGRKKAVSTSVAMTVGHGLTASHYEKRPPFNSVLRNETSCRLKCNYTTDSKKYEPLIVKAYNSGNVKKKYILRLEITKAKQKYIL